MTLLVNKQSYHINLLYSIQERADKKFSSLIQFLKEQNKAVYTYSLFVRDSAFIVSSLSDEPKNTLWWLSLMKLETSIKMKTKRSMLRINDEIL